MTSYADRPWTKFYDEGVPESLEPYPDIGLHELLQQKAAEDPFRDLLITSVKLPVVGRRSSVMKMGELDRLSDALAAALFDKGLKKGDRVAIVLPNCAAFAVAYYGILKAGGVVAACNPTYPPPKMAYQINDSGARFVIAMSLFYEMLKGIRSQTMLEHVIVTNIKEYFPALGKFLFTLATEKKAGHYVESVDAGDFWLQDLLKQYQGQKPDVSVSGEDLALFQYTGGTTGVSKGAVSTHKALVANMMQSKAWVEPLNADYDRQIALGAIPMFHVYGMVLLLSYSVTVGQRIALVVNARDLDDVVDIIDHFKVASFAGVPALFNGLVNHPRIKSGEVSLKSIEFTSSGSAPLPPALQLEYEPMTSGRISQGFGMSEAPTASHSGPIVGEKRLGSIGLPWPDMDMRIVSLVDDEVDMPVGEAGELVMTGPNIMVGYHNMPEETAKVLREKDGKTWLHTGDVAYMDEDGFFYVVDRAKDMSLIGGFNVYPAQIEKVLKEHPAVLEVGVAGVPHPEREGQEALKAWIVFRPGQHVSDEELIAHCAKSLAPYEVPRRYAFIDDLPKTAVGKTLRRELVQMELAERGRK